MIGWMSECLVQLLSFHFQDKPCVIIKTQPGSITLLTLRMKQHMFAHLNAEEKSAMLIALVSMGFGHEFASYCWDVFDRTGSQLRQGTLHCLGCSACAVIRAVDPHALAHGRLMVCLSLFPCTGCTD